MTWQFYSRALNPGPLPDGRTRCLLGRAGVLVSALILLPSHTKFSPLLLCCGRFGRDLERQTGIVYMMWCFFVVAFGSGADVGNGRRVRQPGLNKPAQRRFLSVLTNGARCFLGVPTYRSCACSYLQRAHARFLPQPARFLYLPA